MKKLSVKSMTSGNPLPAVKIKESAIRKFFLLPHILLDVSITKIGIGDSVTRCWYRPEEITETLDNSELVNQGVKVVTVESMNDFIKNHDLPMEEVYVGKDYPSVISDLLNIIELQMHEIEDLKHEIKTLT